MEIFFYEKAFFKQKERISSKFEGVSSIRRLSFFLFLKDVMKWMYFLLVEVPEAETGMHPQPDEYLDIQKLIKSQMNLLDLGMIG